MEIIDEVHQHPSHPPKKGEKGGLCTRSACTSLGAIYQHVDLRSWYCERCARSIQEGARTMVCFMLDRPNEELPDRGQIMRAELLASTLEGQGAKLSLKQALTWDGFNFPPTDSDFGKFQNYLQAIGLAHTIHRGIPDQAGDQRQFGGCHLSIIIAEAGESFWYKDSPDVIQFDLVNKAGGYSSFYAVWYYDAAGKWLGTGAWE